MLEVGGRDENDAGGEGGGGVQEALTQQKGAKSSSD